MVKADADVSSAFLVAGSEPAAPAGTGDGM